MPHGAAGDAVTDLPNVIPRSSPGTLRFPPVLHSAASALHTPACPRAACGRSSAVHPARSANTMQGRDNILPVNGRLQIDVDEAALP